MCRRSNEPPSRIMNPCKKWGILLFVVGALSCADQKSTPTGEDAAAGTNIEVDTTIESEPTDSSDLTSFLARTEEMGITQYKGKITPLEKSRDETITTYGFEANEGPQCMRGSPFQTSVRDVGSDNLVIFLQGGGACWSFFCLAVTGAPAGVPAIDILNPDLDANPTKDWNAVYVPYCDGSFFVGDADIDDNLNDKGIRTHRGLANLTGAYEVAAMRFPNPQKVLLAGSSGGAYGLLMAGALLRHYYPETELIVMADSGIGIARDQDPEYIQLPVTEFNLDRFIPSDCDGCISTGHLTALVTWLLKHDPEIRVGLYSSWYDSIIANVFLQIDPQEHAQSLREQTDLVHHAYPQRFKRFITDGIQHTALIADTSGIIGSDLTELEYPLDVLANIVGGGLKVGGLDSTRIDDFTIGEWLGGLIENDESIWIDILEEAGPPPEE